VSFLNQETPVVLGAEKVAKKIDAVVVFLHSRKIKRGHYEAYYELVTEHAGACPKFEITDKCTRLLEQQIIAQPEFWLWSHKRWKHKRDKSTENTDSIHFLEEQSKTTN
jgi:KDO2-lipid IV(A) lauroyltransferase